MSGAMSRSNNQWLQFHENNQQSWYGDAATDATAVTTTNTSVSNQLSRVTKPTNPRRRSRASRKAPTTLLNTDTTNFRAMVQRYTGGGNTGGNRGDYSTSGPFLSNESSVTSTHQFLNPYESGVVGSSSSLSNNGYNMQFRQPQSLPYFTMTAEDGGSTTAHDGGEEDMAFRHSGSYNW